MIDIFKKYPKISIVTPNLNGSRYLEKTILSIINQKYPNLEYIVVDGGSTDASLDIIKKYQSEISYLISEKDEGMYDAIQKGFAKSTGDIMGWLNSDDMLQANSLFQIAKIFQDNPIVEWIEGINILFDSRGFVTNTHVPTNRHLYYYLLDLQKSKKFGYIQQESTYWKRSLWERAGSSLNTSLKFAGDYELWMRFFLAGEYFTAKTLIGGFRNSNEEQLSKLNFDSYLQEVEEVNKNVLSKLSKTQKEELSTLKFKLKCTSFFLKYKYFLRKTLINRYLKSREINS